MFIRSRVLLCTLAVLCLIDIKLVYAKRSFGGRHSYPKSGGLSGGHHSSGGLSGGGHGYPSSGGLSGGSHAYPGSGGSSGGGHAYPGSGGLSGGGHSYPSSGGMSGGGHQTGGGHTYPKPGGTHGYPGNNGMSGNNYGYPTRKPAVTTHTTNVHHHYHYTYSPPQRITYTPVGGGPAVHYPVYRGQPPTYVYKMQDSGSKYGTLLAGLALLNLGTLAGSAYAHSQSSSHYKPKPGEVCLFGVKKDNGDYEETKIDCQLISSFIIQEEAKAANATNTSITTTVTNVTMVNITNGVPAIAPTTTPAPVYYTMMPNGVLVPVNATSVNITSNAAPNNTVTSSVTITTTTTNTTVTNALDVKGKPVTVTPGMKCFVIRTTPTSRMRKSVPCGLLQTYAEKSIRRNSAALNGPTITMLAVVFALKYIY